MGTTLKYNTLGRTDLKVSALCLGSMTWGTQNTAAEGHAQIDMALDHGINFIDTAEMYPTTPLSKETQGDTERIIGGWVEKSGRRDDVIIATKVTGEGYRNVRGGAPISPSTIGIALENSLRSMKTDYVDLYQLHWPNRGSYMFRKNWRYDRRHRPRRHSRGYGGILECLEGYRREGKIRHFGLSNESAWCNPGCGCPRTVTCRGWYQSRTSTTFSAACSTPIWPSWRITRMLAFCHFHLSPAAC